MTQLCDEINSFRNRRKSREERALANAALLKFTGIELEDAIRLASSNRNALRVRISRLLERERLRGLNGEPNYDLKTHICLKQAFKILYCRRHG